MADPEEEEQWIRNSRDGDTGAYGSLVARYQQMIHALTYRMTGSTEEAADLAQETFIRAFHQLGSFRGDAKWSTWLCRIAMNLCLNWRQRESRRTLLHQAWAAEQTAVTRDDSQETPLDVESIRVQAALNRLPPKQRAAMVLTIYEEMSHAEAAQALGCSETTVSWRLFAARGKLKRWLKSAKQPI